MILSEKEKTTVEDLKTQEQACIEKYTRYSSQAHDRELQDLFQQLAKKEQKHYDTLCKLSDGQVMGCDCNDADGRDYAPKATYDAMTNPQEKKEDCALATDCIGTEKLVSGEYNTNVFNFGDSSIRKLLADIQIEEQNHAEMLWKYKEANGMNE